MRRHAAHRAKGADAMRRSIRRSILSLMITELSRTLGHKSHCGVSFAKTKLLPTLHPPGKFEIAWPDGAEWGHNMCAESLQERSEKRDAQNIHKRAATSGKRVATRYPHSTLLASLRLPGVMEQNGGKMEGPARC